MGWQDRDYIRPDSPQGGFFRGGGGVRSFPWGGSIVTSLIIINVAIYALGAFSPTTRAFTHEWGAMKGGAVLHGQVWRLITAQYLHASIGHLFFNMLALHFMGRSLERLWSPRKFFGVYTLCGLAGTLTLTVMSAMRIIDPESTAVGASGAIFGVVGIVAAMFPNMTIYVQFLFPVRMKTMAFILGGIAVLTIVERGQNYAGEACHLAGLLSGVWWGLRGDAWWTRQGLSIKLPSFWTRTPGRRKFAQKWEERRIDEETIDRILKKVGEQGLHSLSETEKAMLRAATDRQREREAKAGRTDRL